jgi:hypothetical protein
LVGHQNLNIVQAKVFAAKMRQIVIKRHVSLLIRSAAEAVSLIGALAPLARNKLSGRYYAAWEAGC